MTVLYQTIAAHWPSFIERMEEHGGLPKFVRDEFEAYLRCGRLEAGYLELECRTCGQSQLVASSCKRRGFCCLCLGRRMSDTAVHLVAEVLPEVPIRHWVWARYFGVLASHSRYRARVVPSVVEPSRLVPEAAPGEKLELGFGSSNTSASASAPKHGRSRWGWLIARVFRADVDTCCRCGGPMRWVEAATEPAAIARLLAKHGLAFDQPPERQVRVASGQLPLPFA